MNEKYVASFFRDKPLFKKNNNKAFLLLFNKQHI